MKNISHNSGFSIILAIGLVLLLSLTGLYLIEYTVPFARNIKGVENASQAFYESYSGLEDSLLEIYSDDIWEDHHNDLNWALAQDFWYQVTSSGVLIPIAWKGDSIFDADWNRVSQDDPISLLVWKNRLNTWWTDRIRFSVRVPDLDTSNSDDLKTLDGDDDIILWQLSSATESLSSRSWSLVSESDINAGIVEESLWNTVSLSQWVTLDGIDRSFQWFYDNNSSPCNDLNNECVLKISIINPLIEVSDTIIPYLEYQIHIDTVIPLWDSYVRSQGKSYGFSKILELQAPNQSTSSAFDFTVLQ